MTDCLAKDGFPRSETEKGRRRRSCRKAALCISEPKEVSCLVTGQEESPFCCVNPIRLKVVRL